MGQKIKAKAPVRFCDLGGWTDTRILLGLEGAVTNFTARMKVHVTLTVRSTPQGESRVQIISHDTDEQISVSSREIRNGEYEKTLDLFQAAFHAANLELTSTPGMGYRRGPREAILEIRSDAPPGSGLGTSAAAGVAALAALHTYVKQYGLSAHALAREAHKLEVEHLKLECGVQDQYASAYGGANFMEVRYPDARVQLIPIDGATLHELNSRLVIVYTGKSHFSSAIHEKVIAEYEAGHNVAQFDRLIRCARMGHEALKTGDLNAFGAMMCDNWDAQKALHPDITTWAIEDLHRAALDSGAIGFKANGAGGGGTVTILAGNGMRSMRDIRAAVRELGMEILPAEIGFEGVQVWKTDEPD